MPWGIWARNASTSGERAVSVMGPFWPTVAAVPAAD